MYYGNAPLRTKVLVYRAFMKICNLAPEQKPFVISVEASKAMTDIGTLRINVLDVLKRNGIALVPADGGDFVVREIPGEAETPNAPLVPLAAGENTDIEVSCLKRIDDIYEIIYSMVSDIIGQNPEWNQGWIGEIADIFESKNNRWFSVPLCYPFYTDGETCANERICALSGPNADGRYPCGNSRCYEHIALATSTRIAV